MHAPNNKMQSKILKKCKNYEKKLKN